MSQLTPFLSLLLLVVAMTALSVNTGQTQDNAGQTQDNAGQSQEIAGQAQETAGQDKEVVNHDFRVTIKVFDDKGEKLDEHLVVFDKAMVYDFDQGDGKSAIVFDLQRKRVILLDPESKVRSTVNTEDLTHLVAQIRASADDKSRERLGLNAVAELTDEQYVVHFGKIQYSSTTQAPSDRNIALAFGQFADWASRLNAARHRGLPPFARMSLNQKVASAGELPKELELQVKRPLKTDRYRSTYELIEQTSEKDRKQITEVGSMLALYREVPLGAFPR